MNRLATLSLGALLSISCSACGAGAAPRQGAIEPRAAEGGDAASSSAVVLPELPAVAPAEEAPRVAPPIGDVAGAEAALDAGFYDAVREALPRLAAGPSAALVEARLALVTGRYDEVAALAERAAREA
ncbi:MAG: hypothetical protein H5U40_10445, partial [Polyangiaceae bacterium]|nr:hypothetical protein [Polyangiaceae bacterium]